MVAYDLQFVIKIFLSKQVNAWHIMMSKLSVFAGTESFSWGKAVPLCAKGESCVLSLTLDGQASHFLVYYVILNISASLGSLAVRSAAIPVVYHFLQLSINWLLSRRLGGSAFSQTTGARRKYFTHRTRWWLCGSTLLMSVLLTINFDCLLFTCCKSLPYHLCRFLRLLFCVR